MRFIRLIFISAGFLLIMGCEIYSGLVSDKIVIGAVEPVLVEPGSKVYDARIDTGATTTSIDARNVVVFERDGKKWVRFNLSDSDIEIEKPVIRTAHILQHGEKEINIDRQVVKMKLTLKNISTVVDVSLANRQFFEYKVLIGRNFLQGNFLVDVSRNQTSKSNTEVDESNVN